MFESIIAVINNSDNVRQASSSGGVFYALAQWTIAQGGLVIGAAYGDSASVILHIAVDKLTELHRLQKSKYAPSSLSDPSVAEALQQADTRWVLFSGTPCQVKAIRQKYHGRKLLCVEVACHGVPKREAYLQYLAENHIEKIDFRCKKPDGWQGIELIYDDGRVCYEKSTKNSFYRKYSDGSILREACHHCVAKHFSSGADFTLADFWGIEAFAPEMNDGKGASVVILHTALAKKLWKEVSSQFRQKKISFYEATHWNPCIYRDATAPITACEKWEERKYILRQYLRKVFAIFLRPQSN